MHDGYLFTLAICGTATATSPAPMLLNAMLAALPPVKRAAWLGEVVPLDSSGRWHDPLLDAVVADMRDAEVLLVVSPLYSSRLQPEQATAHLPARLVALLERAAPLAAAGHLRGACAAFVGIDMAGSTAAASNASAVDRIVQKQMLFAPLQRFCVLAGMEIVGALLVPAPEAGTPAALADSAADILTPACELARRSYAQARQRLPHALPEQP